MNLTLEHIPFPTVICDGEGNIELANQLFLEAFADDWEQRPDKSIFSVFSTLDQAPFRDAFESRKALYTTTHFKETNSFRYQFRFKLIQEQSHEQICVTIDKSDVAPSSNNEDNLLRTVIDILPAFIYAKDSNSRFILANKEVASLMSDGDPDKLLGKTDFDFYPHRLALKFYCDEQEVINSGRAKHGIIEQSKTPQMERPIWMNTTKVPLKNEQGEVIGIVGTGTNITQTKETQDKLEELENIVNNSSSCALLIKANPLKWEIKYYSQNLDKLGFYSKDLAKKGQDYLSMIYEEDLVGVKKHTIGCFENDIKEFTHEYRLKNHHDEFLWVEAHSLLREKTEEGDWVFQCFITNISRKHELKEERDSMELQLRQAQKLEAIGQLAAGISHEINTPIQFITDNLNFLEESFESLKTYLTTIEQDADIKHQLEQNESIKDQYQESDIDFLKEEIPLAISQSLEGAIRVRDIVKAMKEFSHSGSGEIELLDVNEAVKSTTTVARNEWKYVSEVVLHLDDSLPNVPVQIGPFKQTLLNLVVNAAHTIEDRVKKGDFEKGTITITTSHTDKYAKLSVQDTGNGIPQNIANKIYEPFFTTKEVGKGTGQGLAIAYDIIVRKLKGKLYFETGEGEGTTFFIELPLTLPEKVSIKPQ